jgi:hypothetical protein
VLRLSTDSKEGKPMKVKSKVKAGGSGGDL